LETVSGQLSTPTGGEMTEAVKKELKGVILEAGFVHIHFVQYFDCGLDQSRE